LVADLLECLNGEHKD
jgi:hypothetical protein